jgi:hypothetical protein
MKKQLTTSLQEAQRVNEIIRSCSDFKAALKRVASNVWEYDEEEDDITDNLTFSLSDAGIKNYDISEI